MNNTSVTDLDISNANGSSSGNIKAEGAKFIADMLMHNKTLVKIKWASLASNLGVLAFTYSVSGPPDVRCVHLTRVAFVCTVSAAIASVPREQNTSRTCWLSTRRFKASSARIAAPILLPPSPRQGPLTPPCFWQRRGQPF